MACNIPPQGWTCSRTAGHSGPCAASPENVISLHTQVERFGQMLREADFTGPVAEALNAYYCCNGYECGCQARTVGEYLENELLTMMEGQA